MISSASPRIFHVHFVLMLILRDCSTGRGDLTPKSPLAESPNLVTNAGHRNETKDWPVPLPSRFHYYDLDGDGFLTLKELAKVTGTGRKDARLPFEAADADGNKRITLQEFNEAPWLFGDLPPSLSPLPNPVPNRNRTSSSTPRRRPSRRGHSKKKIRRQHQRKSKKKYASTLKSKKHKSSE